MWLTLILISLVAMFVWALVDKIIGNKEPRKFLIAGGICFIALIISCLGGCVSCVRSCSDTYHSGEFNEWTGERKSDYVIRDMYRMQNGY